VVVANAEQLVAVASLADRAEPAAARPVLVIAEEAGLSSVVVLNKIDLAPRRLPGGRAGVRGSRLRGSSTCAVDGRGVSELAATLAAGSRCSPGQAAREELASEPVDPALDIRVREISQKTGKGKHTTSSVRCSASRAADRRRHAGSANSGSGA